MDDFTLRPADDLGLRPWERMSSVKRESGPFLTAVHTGWAVIARTYFSLWHRLRVIGREHLPTTFPFVLCSNHASHLDALALVAPLKFNLRAKAFALAAGDTFFESPLVTAFAAGFINALPVWRKKRTPRALQELREKLVNTPCGYVLFPEGGRTRDGALTPFKAGVGMVVAGTSVPVIPCHISGSFDAMPAGVRFPRPGRITIRVGPAVTFDGVKNDKHGWSRVMTVVEDRVRALVPPGGRERGKCFGAPDVDVY